ncbi:MAG: ABC transporter ATP-binding protein, partial [Lachnospiraceae bacterium]
MKNKLKKLIAYYKPYQFLFFSDMFFAIIGALVTLAIPLVIRFITNEVIYFDAADATNMIIKLGIFMCGLVVIGFGCDYYIAYFGHMMGVRMEANMRTDIFRHYQKLTFAFYDNQKVGHLLSRITSDLFDISELLHHGPEDLVISAIKIIGSFIILLSIDVKLTLVAFTFVPIMIVYAGVLNTKMKAAFKKNRAKIADINSQIEDSLSGIRVVKSFANEEVEMEKFCTGNSHFVKAKRKSYLYMGAYYSGLNAMSSLITVVVLLTGFQLITTKAVNVSDLITFLLYINNFIEPVKKLVNFTEQFQNGYSGFERFLEVMEIAPDIQDDKDAVSVNELKGKIQFQDV